MDDTAKVLVVQRIGRGWLARQHYVSKLYAQYEQQEQQRLTHEREQVQGAFAVVEKAELQRQDTERDLVEKHREFMSRTRAQGLWKKVRLNMNSIRLLKARAATEAAAEDRAQAEVERRKAMMVLSVERRAELENATTAEHTACARMQRLFRAYRAKTFFVGLLAQLAQQEADKQQARAQEQIQAAFSMLELQQAEQDRADRQLLDDIEARQKRFEKRRRSLPELKPPGRPRTSTVQTSANSADDRGNTSSNAVSGGERTIGISRPAVLVETKRLRVEHPAGSHVTTFAATPATAAAATGPGLAVSIDNSSDTVAPLGAGLNANARPTMRKPRPQLSRQLSATEIHTLERARAQLELNGDTSSEKYKQISTLIELSQRPRSRQQQLDTLSAAKTAMERIGATDDPRYKRIVAALAEWNGGGVDT